MNFNIECYISTCDTDIVPINCLFFYQMLYYFCWLYHLGLDSKFLGIYYSITVNMPSVPVQLLKRKFMY